MANTSENRWEYRDFIYHQWNARDIWASLSPNDRDTASLAQLTFWHSHQAEIKNTLNRWQEQGWEALGEPGPASIRLRKSIRIDSHIAPSDILLWFMTLGIALFVQLVLDTPRRYATYKPLEFRLRMRHLNVTNISLEAPSASVQQQIRRPERCPSLAEESYRTPEISSQSFPLKRHSN
ncbi:MAG TPA: hypothetical protein VKQ72_05240 [Aggregatilineales bacterium]|nr:hypothetical protein [Aggregatilineales bacterium]